MYKNPNYTLTIKEYFDSLQFNGVLILGIMLFSALGYWISKKFDEKSIKEQSKRELLIMAPSINQVKLKLIGAKNNSNIPINFNDQYINLIIKNSDTKKNEKRIIYTMKKNGFACEQLYNVTENAFKIDSAKVYHYKTTEIQNSSIMKNTTETYIQKGNSRPDIIKYCQINKNIEFDVIK